jgi:hypothetical protein
VHFWKLLIRYFYPSNMCILAHIVFWNGGSCIIYMKKKTNNTLLRSLV